jgi:hypothetical protein
MPNRSTLILSVYVLDGSPACDRAFTMVLRALRHFDPSRVEFKTRNLSTAIERTTEDRGILIAPTLRMLGNVTGQLIGEFDTSQVIDLVRRSGLLVVAPRPYHHGL